MTKTGGHRVKGDAKGEAALRATQVTSGRKTDVVRPSAYATESRRGAHEPRNCFVSRFSESRWLNAKDPRLHLLRGYDP